ncbi:MAG: GT2 family glycosyltransferase [Candidatus Azotimanducaceae bacterium]|jgi:GT2 family glycosyltransferase
MWILRDFDGALKFVEWLIVNTLDMGFFPMLGELISRVAFLRKSDHALYQNWMANIEEIPPLTLSCDNKYDVILMLDSVESSLLERFFETTLKMAWVDTLTVVSPKECLCPESMDDEKLKWLNFDSFRSKIVDTEYKNNVFLAHTLGFIESSWVSEIDAMFGLGIDLVLPDHDSMGDDDCRYNPILKSGFSRELIFDPAYAPCIFVDKQLFCECFGDIDGGVEDKESLSYQERAHQIMANMLSNAKSPKHLDRILYHLVGRPLSWRTLSKPFVEKNRKFNLSTHLSNFPEVYMEPSIPPLVSIIIPIRDNINLLIDCVRSIKKHQYKSRYEIIVLDNQSKDPDTLNWLEKSAEAGLISRIKCDFDFNWSRLNNVGIDAAVGDVMLLLNNDTVVITPDWLDRLAALALEESTGVIGPLLLYPDGCIQHAGVVIGYGGFADHLYLGEPITNRKDECFVSPLIRRDVSACTGACQVFSKKFYQENGPFNENLLITGDIEFCIRSLNKGFRNIYDPSVSLYHLESKTRKKGLSKEEKSELKTCLGELTVLDDRYFNNNLSRSSRSPMFTLLKPIS